MVSSSVKRWYSALLFLIPFLTFFRLLSGEFVWDDASIIIDVSQLVNPFLVDRLPWVDGFYRPMAFVSLQLDYLVWGTKPFGFHLTNLIIHSANVVLLFAILKRLVGAETAFFASLLFGVHPAVGEAVGWISCRFDLLALLFALLSMYCLILYLEEGRKAIIFPVLVFSLFSVLSKETGIVLTLLLPVVYCFYRRGSLKPLLLFAFPLSAILLVFLATLGGNVLSRYGNWNDALAAGLKLFGLYVYKVFSWRYLTPYSTCLFSELGTTTVFISLTTILLMLSVLFLSLRRRDVAGMGIIWFVAALLPGLYVSLAESYRLPGADRFLYSALPGLTILLTIGCVRVFDRKAVRLLLGLALILIPVSFARSSIWLNEYNLWSYADGICEGKWSYPLNNHANAAFERGRLDEAELLYGRMIKGLKEGRVKTLYEVEQKTNSVYGLAGLARVNEERHQYEVAGSYYGQIEEEYDRIVKRYPGAEKLELLPVNYRLALFYYNQSLREEDREPLVKALQRVDLVLKHRQAWLEPHRLKSYILLKMGNCREAMDYQEKALGIFGRDNDLLADIWRFREACEGG